MVNRITNKGVPFEKRDVRKSRKYEEERERSRSSFVLGGNRYILNEFDISRNDWFK